MTAKKPDSRNMATRRRQERQEALRESLSKQAHIKHITDICGELNDEALQLDALMIQRKKIVIDTKLRLINKYLPDLKNTEITGEAGGNIVIKVAEFKS